MTLRKLKSIYANIPVQKDYKNISLELTTNDLLPETVDFHISPMINILMSKPWVVKLIEKHYPNDVLTTDERIKNIIWRMRSGINFKIDYFSGMPIDWLEKPFNNTPDADRFRYEAIYSELTSEINNISTWFLEKNK